MITMKKFLKSREISVIIPLLAVIIIPTIFYPAQFLSFQNIVDMLRSISYSIIVAVGMTYVVISSNLDLSVGSTMTITGMVTGYFLMNGMAVFPAILIGIATSLVIGFLNGYMCVNLNINSLIATLGTQYVCKGLVYVMSGGASFYPFPKEFTVFGKGKLWGIPYSVFFAAFIVIIAIYVLEQTSYGRSIYALGGNGEAARLAGLNVSSLRRSLYVLIAVLSGLTGILKASRLGTSSPESGTGVEMSIIAGVIIGGASLSGGVGNMLGTVLGVSLMEILKNALVIMRISSYWQNVATGILMIIAVSVDSIRNSKKK